MLDSVHGMSSHHRVQITGKRDVVIIKKFAKVYNLTMRPHNLFFLSF